jgi:hypothetical protein
LGLAEIMRERNMIGCSDENQKIIGRWERHMMIGYNVIIVCNSFLGKR